MNATEADREEVRRIGARCAAAHALLLSRLGK
ncbi:hypothetical protein ABIA32_004422 [Streptacidiphilus sp. MAP12-20]